MKKNIHHLFVLFLLSSVFTFTNCSKDKNGDRLIFTIEDDKAMGKQSAHQIDSIYAGKILDPAQYPLAYNYVEAAKQNILNSGKIVHKEEFVWEVKIINDSTLNAFCTPGGHIYFYTGLIKYLEQGDHFAGVLGHEMAHADLRHTSKQLQRQYGITVLLGVLTGGNPGTLSQIAASLALLKYSRAMEEEADAASVIYLANEPDFACNGAAGFFAKLIAAGQSGGGPIFLSTHPDAPDRVAEINARAAEIGCDTIPNATGAYQAFKNSLP